MRCLPRSFNSRRVAPQVVWWYYLFLSLCPSGTPINPPNDPLFPVPIADLSNGRPPASRFPPLPFPRRRRAPAKTGARARVQLEKELAATASRAETMNGVVDALPTEGDPERMRAYNWQDVQDLQDVGSGCGSAFAFFLLFCVGGGGLD